MTFALLTSGEPQFDGRITDFVLDATIQLWVLKSLMQESYGVRPARKQG